MNQLAIRVEHLSKQFQIGGPQERYKTLRDTLADAASAPFRRIHSLLKRANVRTPERSNTIWALKDVSFEVQRGEVIGIIGRNGAGKSTLLKVLSRITEPTEGYAELHGRVGTLLEVGTGFHPELTGGENIYLNGTILGMKRTEIERKFDEVLAVGDAQFQKKCLGKMEDVANQGRTVLFVSHNMAAVRTLCTQTVLLRNGSVAGIGPTDQIIAQYLASSAAELSPHVTLPHSGPGMPGEAIGLQLLAMDGTPSAEFRLGEPWCITLEFDLNTPLDQVVAAV